MEINGYVLESDEWRTLGGGGQCNIGIKNGKKYHIKRLLQPKYPESKNFSEEYRRQKIKECDEWIKTRRRVIKDLPGTGSGNLVKPIEYFRVGPFYYEISKYIEDAGMDVKDVHTLKKKDLARVMLTISKSLADMHKAGLIHGDLDTGNIIISTTAGGNPVCKLIDFSDAFYETDIPKEIRSKDFWWSPEMALYNKNLDQDPNPMREYITCKTDVFSLGIVFHQYCSSNGKGPICTREQPWMAYLSGETPRVDSEIDPVFAKLISMMLNCEPDQRPSMEQVYQYLYRVIHQEDMPIPEPVAATSAYSPGSRLNGRGGAVSQIDVLNAKKIKLYFTSGDTQIMPICLALELGYITR